MTAGIASEAPRPALVVFAAAVTIVLWSGTAIANKVAVGHMDPLTAGILRSMLAGLIAAVIAVASRLPLPVGPAQWGLLLVSGISSFAVWPMILSLGLGSTSANHAGLIMAMLPVFTGLIAALFDRRWPSMTWWLGVVIAAIGTAYLVYSRSGGSFDDGATLSGDLIVLSGVIVCALGYVTGGRLSQVLGMWSTSFWGLAVATTITIPTFLLLLDRTDWSLVATPGWAAIAYMTVFSSIVGYSLWFWSLGRGGIARIGSFQFAQPVLTLLFAVPILDERLTWPLVLSAAIILAGVAIAQRKGD